MPIVDMINTQYVHVADACPGPESECREEPDVFAEPGLRICVDTGIEIWLAIGERLEHERQHQHAGAGDRPCDQCTGYSGLLGEPSR